MLNENQKQAILATLVDQDRIAKQVPTTGTELHGSNSARVSDCYNAQPWWCCPKYRSPNPSVQDWNAFTRNRSRYVVATSGTCALALLISLAIPPSFGRWMLVGCAVFLALLAAWQHDVASRELRLLASMTDEEAS